MPPHQDLVARLANLVDESPKAQDITWLIFVEQTNNSVIVASFGIKFHWKDNPPRTESFLEITEENHIFTTIGEMFEFYQNNPKTIKYGKQESLHNDEQLLREIPRIQGSCMDRVELLGYI